MQTTVMIAAGASVALVCALARASPAGGRDSGTGSPLEAIAVTDRALDPFTVRVPVVPKEPVFSVRAFGATGDGKTLDTAAIQKAIDACHAAGGGIVHLSPGTYLSGAVRLKTGVFLRLDEDATLRAWWPEGVKVETIGGSKLNAAQRAMYAKLFPPVAAHGPGAAPSERKGKLPSPLVYAENAERIGVIGGGVLDGRLRTMILHRCRNIRLEGVSVHCMRFWTVHLLHCDDVLLDGMSLLTSNGGHNADGVDLDTTRNVIVRNCHFETFDDCLAIKSGWLVNDPLRDRPSANILIEDCSMYKGNGSVVIGSDMTHGVENVLARNISAGAGRGCRIKTGAVRRGFVRNITYRDILSTSPRPWSFEFGYAGGMRPRGDIPLPVIENIRIENLQRPGRDGGYVTSFEVGTKKGTLEPEIRNEQRRALDRPSLQPVVAGINRRLRRAEDLLAAGNTAEAGAILKKLADRFGDFHAGRAARAALQRLPETP